MLRPTWHQVDWNAVLDGTMRAPFYYNRSGIIHEGQEEALKVVSQYSDDEPLIFKPSDSSRGRGVKCFLAKDFARLVEEDAELCESLMSRNCVLIQRYVPTMLIRDGKMKGRKFNIRVLVLAVGADPTTVYLVK